ncbi:MAG: hypothetical protein LH472_12010 [Pyrinomonadaceae bacterium]|nr:hypothetical protein [Pyrinomonadaceae bacterium]
MSLPISSTIEMPILQELAATGGSDDVRFLYERLIAYFPQLNDKEVAEIKIGTNKNWRTAVQKAARMLDEKSCLRRNHGFWTLTVKGRETVENESLDFTATKPETEATSHAHIQKLLIEIGVFLGFHAAMEFEFYDVVWRETAKSPRISHIFEVQHKGNLDSAFAKLKRAYQSQRTKPFLVISSEKDFNRARQSLFREFQDIESAVTILTFVQVKKIYQNLNSIGEILPKLLEK